MKLLDYANTLKKLKNDPLGFVVEAIITIIVNIFSPLPLPQALVAQFKVPILGFLASLLVLCFFFIMLIGTMFMSPLIVSSGYWEQFTSIFDNNDQNIPGDNSFGNTNSPKRNPLGGSGLQYATITAYFLDPNYYLRFGRNHNGIDIIPSDNYYQNSQTYKETGKIVVFATMNGSVSHYVDGYGGETIEITNTNNSYKVKYIHFSSVIVTSGNVTAGTPLGIMGGSGLATGDHVHYEVHIKDGNTWRAVNLLNYID